LEQQLSSLDGAWTDDGGKDHALTLRMANMAFAQDGWPIEQAYLDAIARAIGTGLGLVDYQRNVNGARDAINGWVARQTANRIPELLNPTDLTGDSRLTLVNAIYLKAMWLLEFEKGSTANRAFTGADGTVTKVPTMSLYGEQEVPYARGAGWQATELRYLGADSAPLAMTLILPDTLATFERGLTASKLTAIVGRLGAERDRLAVTHVSGGQHDCDVETYPYSLRLFMPRFGIDTRADLVPALRAMGMPAAVDPAQADFSGIVSPDAGRIFIAKVIHQANIDVDEEGTEAAAATAIVMGDTTGGCNPEPAKTITLRLNRPFMFVLRDVRTNAILFMGRVMDPSDQG
jgi:serpin B